MTRKIAGMKALYMLAMRPAPISRSQLEERFGGVSNSILDALVAQGLAEECRAWEGNGWRLTQLGRERCPTRRGMAAQADSNLVDFDEEGQRIRKRGECFHTAIRMISSSHREVSAGEIANCCGVRSAHINGLLKKSIEAGLIQARKDRGHNLYSWRGQA